MKNIKYIVEIIHDYKFAKNKMCEMSKMFKMCN